MPSTGKVAVTPVTDAPVSSPRPEVTIVGIGASAGGLAAFEAFFSGLPSDTNLNLAFVLVQHLAPDHKSLLAELIRRYTRMQVFEIEDGMVVQANCVYVIPPNRDLAFLNGTLQLLERPETHGLRLPIDFFFRSLAQDQHERAIGIVLSGTGSDGTLGLRAIKNEGGMVMAQSPSSTEFDGMPRSALATGLVDFELPAAEMGAKLIAYGGYAFAGRGESSSAPSPLADRALKKIMVLVRAHTGHDLSLYKPSTIFRRIERRMAVHQIETFDGYVKYLQQTKVEVEALFHDLLIGVTHFFRDEDAFRFLEEQVIPKIFSNRTARSTVRVWVPACSTGEEAYSIAMLLIERMAALKQSYPVHVFATDIDSRAIATARIGLYPASIAADLSPERLSRFFTAEAGGYRIHKSVRDLLVFSPHDLVKDPPFSKLDLISCRNVLIYMGAELQQKLIPLFHYALKSGGMLFLGTSETAGDFVDLFGVLDRQAKVYQSKSDIRRLPLGPLAELPPSEAVGKVPPPPGVAKPAGPPSLRELTEQALLRQVFAAGALVTARGDILYLHGRAGMFLEPAQGEAGIQNILKMAREGLRPELTLALRQSVSSQETVCRRGLRVRTNGHFTTVTLTVQPMASAPSATAESRHFLVILEEEPPEASQPVALTNGPGIEPTEGADARALLEELRAKEEYLQSANEELQSSGEELKSSNEEMQSVNEELQSTNEELETAKEEMQSVNEELTTVNNELQTKVADLSRAKNDLINLLAGTGIATVFVDLQLRILRFTPTATALINLIPSDTGRPVSHLVSNLVGYDRLAVDAQAVLDTLIPKEVDVQARAGAWYTLRIQPYRTVENMIDGAVITFVDITETVRTREALRKANEQLRLAVVVRDSHDAITVRDLEGRILAWNPAAVRMYGWSEAEALQMNVRQQIPPDRVEQEVQKLAHLIRAELLEPYRTQRLTQTGAVVEISMIATALMNDAGQVYAIATTERAVAGGVK